MLRKFRIAFWGKRLLTTKDVIKNKENKEDVMKEDRQGMDESQRQEELRRVHIDTAKEYAQALKNATSTTLKDVKNIVTGKEEMEGKRDPGLDVPPANVNAYEVKEAVKETIQKGVQTAKETLKGAAQAVGQAMDPISTTPKEGDEFTEELKQKGKEMKEKEENDGLGGKRE